MRKQYTAAFKAKLVLELLKESKSLSQLAAEHKVHPNQLRQWRDAALKELPSLFEKKDQTTDLAAAHERQVEELYSEIGRLTTQVAWLKKTIWSRPCHALTAWRSLTVRLLTSRLSCKASCSVSAAPASTTGECRHRPKRSASNTGLMNSTRLIRSMAHAD